MVDLCRVWRYRAASERGGFVASADDISWKKIRISLQLRDLHPSDMDPSLGARLSMGTLD
jgi:hypothetical protein